MEKNKVYCGDVIELSQELEDNSIHLVVCSPPYAKQRKDLYEGISEEEYPQWTVSWMEAIRPKLASDGSVFIVIRPNLRNGQISDYVLQTRLAVREAGWIECEELIWHKSDAPPLGSILRPRRCWESILWFAKTTKPYADLRACGNKKSKRCGGFAGSERFGEGQNLPVHAGQNRTLKNGTSRCSDVLVAPISHIERGIDHPAMYPQDIPDFLIKTFSQPGDTVLDPFCGAGTTLLSAQRLGRNFLGFDLSRKYVEISRARCNLTPTP